MRVRRVGVVRVMWMVRGMWMVMVMPPGLEVQCTPVPARAIRHMIIVQHDGRLLELQLTACWLELVRQMLMGCTRVKLHGLCLSGSDHLQNACAQTRILKPHKST